MQKIELQTTDSNERRAEIMYGEAALPKENADYKDEIRLFLMTPPVVPIDPNDGGCSAFLCIWERGIGRMNLEPPGGPLISTINP